MHRLPIDNGYAGKAHEGEIYSDLTWWECRGWTEEEFREWLVEWKREGEEAAKRIMADYHPKPSPSGCPHGSTPGNCGQCEDRSDRDSERGDQWMRG